MNDEVRDREGQSATSSALITQASPDQMQSNMARMKAMIELKKDFLKDNLKPGIERDYAEIPGTKKLSLLKPGAEKLLDWHGYFASFECISEKEDWEIGLFAYTYRCTIKQKGSNLPVADCEGDASSYESKYKFEWKYDHELPKNVDPSTLPSKTYGKTVRYQVMAANLADRRNTVRKMAQKRALIGATVLATATSDLFAADVDPDDPDASAANQNSGSGDDHAQASGDYGNPISDKQGKRLYAIRKSNGIDDATFKAWLKAKYGIDDDRTIGYKIYDEIVKACESGKLEMPAAKHSPEPAAKSEGASQQSAPASGGKISTAQLKDFYMLLGTLRKTENQFKEWLAVAYPQMAGYGVNDLMSGDVDRIKEAFQLYCHGEAA